MANNFKNTGLYTTCKVRGNNTRKLG